MKIGGEFNLFVSFTPLAKGLHLLDSVPLLLKLLFPVDIFCNLSWMIARFWLFLEICNKLYYLGGFV